MGDDPSDRIDELEQRIELLESHLGALEARVERTEHGLAPPASAWRAPTQRPAWPPPVIATSPPTTRRPVVLESEVVLKWGGVGLVVLAVGFAVSTAISRGWIGPELQLFGALAVSIALIVAGVRLQPSRPGWTHALCTGGVLALFTTFASDLFLEQADRNFAFAATVAAGLAGTVLARQLPSEWVGSANLLGGLIGWFVIGDTEPPVIASTAWVAALVAVSVALAVRQRWHALRFAAHASGMFCLLGLAGETSETSDTAAGVVVGVAAALLFASLARVPSVGDLTSTWHQLEVQLVIAAAPFAFGIVTLAADLDRDSTVGTTAIAVALGSVLVALGVRGLIHRAHFVSLLIGASVALSIGLAVLLSTTVAFTSIAVQGAGLVVLSRMLDGNVRVLINAGVLTSVAALFDVVEMVESWTEDASVADDLAHAVIIIALAVAVWQTYERMVWRLGALVTLALTLIWTGSVLVHLPQGQAAVSVSWAVIGTAVLVAGALRKMPDVGAVGLAVLALTVGKLLTVDLQEVDTLWRAGLFFIVGLGFLRLGFLLPRLMGTDERADPPAR